MVGNWRRPNQTHYTGDTKELKSSHHSLSHPGGQRAKLLHLITPPPTGVQGWGGTGHFAFLAFPVAGTACTEASLS